MEPYKIKVSERFMDESPESRRRRLMAFRFIDVGKAPTDESIDRISGGDHDTAYDYTTQGGVADTTFTMFLGGGNASSFMDDIAV